MIRKTLSIRSLHTTITAALSRLRETLPGSSNIYEKTLGQVLTQKGIITEEQLQNSLKAQRDYIIRFGKGIKLGRAIVNLGYTSEEKLVQAINEDYRLSITSLSDNIREIISERRKSFAKGFSTPRIPIRLQLSIAVTLIIILTIFTLSFVNLSRQKELLYKQTIKIGMVSLNYFSANSRIPLLEKNILALNTIIQKAGTVEGLLYAIIVDNNHKIMAHTDLNKIGTSFGQFDDVKEKTRKGDITYFNFTSSSGERILNLNRSVQFKGKKLGEVHVGVSIGFIEQVIKDKRTSIIVMALFIIFFGIIIAVLLGLWFSRPISKLVLATKEIATGHYRHKTDVYRNDEFGTLAMAFNNMANELNMKSLMQDSFGKYVGPEVLEMIMANPENSWLKGHRNEATILFSDIRGFTSYSEVKEPEDILENLNEYLEIATQAILDYGGYIDKFVGDAVLGVFGVPVFFENHKERAVRAAFELQKKVLIKSIGGNDLLKSIGIGINSGIVVSGNVGSQIKMEYTVIGDSVNVASRLNGLAGPGEIIISKNIYEQLEDMLEVEPLLPKKIKGISAPVETYKLLNIKEKNNVDIAE